MVTYLTTFPLGDTKILWWAHTLALAAFLPMIPRTKHLHLLLSPFSVFNSRGLAFIPPLSDENDFGLQSGRDVTRLTALQAYSCVECGRCTEHCPAYNTGKVLDPREIALGVRRYLNEFGPASETPLLGKHISQEAAFQCTTCGACEFQCPVGVEHLPMILGLRRGAVNTGKWEDSYGTKLFLALERQGNAMGFPSADRDKFIAREQFPIFDGTQEYCLWLGCMGAYDPQGREIISAFARVMRHLGTSFGVLQKEKCTGDPARRLGNDLVFQQLAEANLETLAQSKAAKIVSICPHCVRTISTDWREHGQAPPIEHHSEFMARFQDKLPRAPGGSIVYHDPCYLGRYREVYDAPREVLARSGQVIEPARTRERSFCCGAGGGLAFLGEESGERVSHNRARELAATGASTVAAACPFCNTMFRDALTAVSPAPPKLLDIAQIAADAIATPQLQHDRGK
jgi:Fe-S oxidoreductase